MDWLTFTNVTAGLTTLFTGLTGFVTWRLYQDQKAQQLPAVFLRCETYDNGCKLRVTVRNRADHPMRVTEITVLNSARIGLAEYTGGISGHLGNRPAREVYGRAPARRAMPVAMTLTSAKRDDDSGYREYVLFAANPPARIEVEVTCDPSDGSNGLIKVKRTLSFSEKEREIIAKMQLHTD